jgi:hypothetical protein
MLVCTTVLYTISRTIEISRHIENKQRYFFNKLTTVQSYTCIDIQYYESKHKNRIQTANVSSRLYMQNVRTMTRSSSRRAKN